MQTKRLSLVLIVWSLFQLWYASPLPYVINIGIFNDTQARAIHLAFALFLAFTLFRWRRSADEERVPLIDWAFAAIGAFAAAYLFIFQQELADRSGAPTTLDLVTAVAGMLLLLEATRRSLGPPLMIVALLFLVYTFAGPYMPEVISHKGASLNKAMSHQWLTSEGVFGVALGVSTSFVFLFVLFGSLLEQAGAGHYFTQVAFSLLGHLRGGPAKAAVVSSAMTGMISGSSIANVVTTGTFTIPLMKRVGFPPYKAAAVEVASSTNGQLTPPIMGAAAFLMVEYVGISYIEVIKHAFLPAVISYLALIYIVHLEALKADMKGLPRVVERRWFQTLFSLLTVLVGLVLLSLVIFYGIGWLKDVLGDSAFVVVAGLFAAAYVWLLRIAAHNPPPIPEGHEAEIEVLPEPGPTIKSGLHFLLPIAVLIWCLAVERFSPGLAAFWAVLFQIFILLTQRPIIAFFRDEAETWADIKQGIDELVAGLREGAFNMIPIAIATATAGVVVGTVTLTGIGLVMTELVEFLSAGSMPLVLLFTAVISLLLGMGLPTTANYIVVSTLMAPVIVTLGAENGMLIPLVAVHMFVFYFGILADDTPPVGLAAFAGAGIAGADPIRTGIQGFTYDMRTAVLPFMFIYNTELLLIGVESIPHLLITVVGAILAMMLFASATQGYMLVRNRPWESVLFLLLAFSLFRPGFWWDMVYPPYEQLHPSAVLERAEKLPPGSALQLHVEGENIDGDHVSKLVSLHLPAGDDGAQRLSLAGLVLRLEDARVLIDQVMFGSEAEQAGIDLDWEITGLQIASDRLPKQLVYIPVILLLMLLVSNQQRRRRAEQVHAS